MLVLVACAGLLPAVTQTMYLPTINEVIPIALLCPSLLPARSADIGSTYRFTQVISDLDTSGEMVAWTLSVYALGTGKRRCFACWLTSIHMRLEL